ncbi:uncharacterized protein LOC131015916 isoform X11 [Salvia miltiorrhiza]|uniref:uncharacterized protein LOC131015916 isoform X11 n=1 Tax=Salvia miltiorrhiza TaxID=226208 RepID=UPI0025ACDA69|nr:uncharacterized protein LOC131015916 isoform X11 [Salvia miltiorrhiza]
MSAQSFAVLPQVDNCNGQVVPVAKLNIKLQVAPIIPHPHVKRKAIANPRALSGQWRKISPQPAISDSIPQQRQSIPASPAPINIPPAPLRVKWKEGRVTW